MPKIEEYALVSHRDCGGLILANIGALKCKESGQPFTFEGQESSLPGRSER